ncbi:MAG: hypothetical protein IT278_10275 [Ignavibacteriaceae bacterium]|jgi:hypothetical protein|nr:hypothetical protein [Ignavibacteriaceae bacterium]
MGREIVTLISSEIPAGKHSVTFDASNLPSGIYLLRLIAGKNQNIIKMTLNK